MADTKISGLPASTVPLAGTEVLPIVQSSTTKQVSIANVTAGRAVSALSVATTADTTPSSSLGAFSYGTLTYTDVNHLATFQTSVPSYCQVEIQNTSVDAAASADMIVTNNNTTASTYYGDFGMNSSGWVGTAPFNTPNNVYLTSTTADLAVGTTTANAIRFATNSAEVARMFSSGGVSIGNSTDPGNTNLSVTGSLTLNSNARLYGEASDNLSLYNSTTAQTFNIYNTRTDASNYERVALGWQSNTFYIDAQGAGTGGIRVITLRSATTININTGGYNFAFTGTAFRQSSGTGIFDLGAQGNKFKTLYLVGGVTAGIVTKTTTYSAGLDDRTILGDATSAGFTITLPDATTNTGRYYTIKKIDSSVNVVTVGTTSSQTIDGATTKTLLTQYSFVEVQSNGTAWYIV